MVISDLLPNVDLENYTTEFKAVLREGPNPSGKDNYEVAWLKEICAFANSQGGIIYVGVEDQTHKILAMDHVSVDKTVLLVQRMVKEHIAPTLKITYEPIEVPNTKPARYVLAIHVEKSLDVPVMLKYGGYSSIYVRNFGSVSIATPDEIRNMVYDSERVHYDALMTKEAFNEADFSYLFSSYRKMHHRDLTKNQLISIGFMGENGFLSKGALLFKDSCKDSKTLMVCTTFPGYDKGGLVLSNIEKFQGNLLQELHFAVNYIQSHSVTGIKKLDIGAQEIFSYPYRAISEAVANAIGHRNYYIDGSQIEVNLYLDRLEIISPGSCVGGRYLQDETDLKSLPPLRRNDIICSVLNLFNYMDKYGTGFDKIESEYKPYQTVFRPRATANSQYFALTLANLCYAGGIAKEKEAHQIQAISKLKGQNDLSILAFCYNSPKTIGEIAERLSLQPSSYFRKQVIQRLVDEGYLAVYHGERPKKYLTVKEKVYVD